MGRFASERACKNTGRRMIEIHRDGKNQPYIEWEQAPVPGGYKRV